MYPAPGVCWLPFSQLQELSRPLPIYPMQFRHERWLRVHIRPGTNVLLGRRLWSRRGVSFIASVIPELV